VNERARLRLIVNPDGLRNQVEWLLVQTLSRAGSTEERTFRSA
jgi:hypothetical protein